MPQKSVHATSTVQRSALPERRKAASVLLVALVNSSTIKQIAATYYTELAM